MADIYYPGIAAGDAASVSEDGTVSAVVTPNATYQVFERSDTTYSTPLTIKTPSGIERTEVPVGALPVFPDVYVVSENFSHNWKSGDLVFRRDSQDAKDKAVADALAAVQLAATNAGAAAEAEIAQRIAAGEFNGLPGRDGSNVVPTAEAIATEIQTPGTPANTALSATIASEIGEFPGMAPTISGLLGWRVFLASVNTGQGRLSVVADSIGAGVGATESTAWPTQLESLLEADGILLGGDGFVSPAPTSVPTTQWTFTGTWTFDPAALGKNLGARGGAAGDTATYTSRRPSTVVSVLAYGAGGSQFDVEVDGVSRGALVTSGGASDIRVLTITGLPRTTHTVKLTTQGGNSVLAGISTHGDGLVIDNIGRSGISTTGWVDTTSDLEKIRAALPSNGSRAHVVALGTNDALRAITGSNGTTLETYTANMQTIVGRYAAEGPVLVVAPPPAVTAPRDQSYAAYGAAAQFVARRYGAPALDLHLRWISGPVASDEGLLSVDGIHPSSFGYTDYAQAVHDTVVTKPLLGIVKPLPAGVPAALRQYKAAGSLPNPVSGWKGLAQSTTAKQPALVSVDGKPAVRFDGVDDNLYEGVPAGSKFTAILRVKMNAATASRNVFALGGYRLGLNGSLQFMWFGAGFLNGSTADTGWHTIAVTADQDTDAGTLTVDGTAFTGSVGAHSGSGFSIGLDSFNSAFDVREIYIWDRVLTTQQISDMTARVNSDWA